MNVPLAELVESSTNPRKTFDEARLEELAESIRSKGVLSPLLARRVNSHFEIVSGARRYRAAQRAGLRGSSRPHALSSPTPERSKRKSSKMFNALTCIRSRKRKGFARLLEREGAAYTIEKIAAKTRQECPPTSPNGFGSWTSFHQWPSAFTAGHIGIEHALLIAKLASGRAGEGIDALL